MIETPPSAGMRIEETTMNKSKYYKNGYFAIELNPGETLSKAINDPNGPWDFCGQRNWLEITEDEWDNGTWDARWIDGHWEQ